jgi:hypothetical protein
VVCLEDAVLVRAKLFEFLLEKLRLLVGDGLFVQNKNVADIVVVNLIECKYEMIVKVDTTSPFLSDPSTPAFFPSSPTAASG